MGSIISASRRTDIPRYYARWFLRRRRAGFAEFRNAFGGKGRVSLRDEDVLAYLFWTRHAAPFQENLEALRGAGIPFAFQYTLTGYGPDLEPSAPRLQVAIDDLLATSHALPDAGCIQWRYDPILLSSMFSARWHEENFRNLARLLRGSVRVVNVSFTEPYLRTVRRMEDPSMRYRQVDPRRHKTVARLEPPVAPVAADGDLLLRDLADIAREHDMELRACSNPELALPRSRCCGPELFATYGETLSRTISALPPGPSRGDCRCIRAVDIGMDNTCIAGCRYCYATVSHKSAHKNHARHHPGDSSLR